ncbi:unnamed protein product [Rotaria socialis]|nr:unnamed protein product [Rotaria socialis]
MAHEQTLYNAKKSTIEELNNDIKKRQDTLTNIQSNLGRKTTELSDKQKQIKGNTGRKRALEKDVENIKTEKGKKDIELRDARSRVLEQENKVKRLDQQLKLLNGRDQQLSNQATIAENKLELNRSEIIKSTMKVTEMNRSISDKRTRQTNGQRIIDASNTILKALDDQMVEANEKIRQREFEYEKLTDQLALMNTTLNANEQEKMECHKKLKELDNEITSFKVRHYQQQEEYHKESNKIILRHPEVVRIQNQEAQRNIHLQKQNKN